MNKGIRFLFFSLILTCSFLFSNDDVGLLNKGILLLKQGQYEESLKVFQEVQKIDTDNAVTYYYIGEALYCMGKTEQAINNYKRAIEIQPSVPEYYFALAMVYLSINNNDHALENLNKTLEIAPNTITGKKAKKLKEEITSSIQGKEIVKKWIKSEEEEAARLKESEVKTQVAEGQTNEMGELVPKEVVKKEDIRKVIRKIKFETETERKKASATLQWYTQAELQQVVIEMIDIATQEKDIDVKKNLMFAIGKASVPESVEFLLKILQDNKETFDIRIVSLESLSGIITNDVVVAARNTLSGIVTNREQERKDAQKKIEEITKKLENLQAKKDEIQIKNVEQQEKLNQLNMKLAQASTPAEHMDIQQPRISPQELTKIRKDINAINAILTKQTNEMRKMEEEAAELEKQKMRYESLLAKRAEDKKISFQPRPSASGLPPEMGPSDMPPEMSGEPLYVETDEEKNEIFFAISLIKFLGKLRDKESLAIIKRAWTEYGVEQQQIYYFLSIARLSDFSGIDMLIARLRKDYPTDGIKEEVSLRTEIIDVIGDYLLQTPDEKLQGLIEYLSEEGGYPEIRKAAAGVLAKITQRSK